MIPRPDIAPLLQQHFVALAGDADLPEPPVHQLLFKLRNASVLPIVILADEQGRFLEGSAGAADPQRLKAMLERARPDGQASSPAGG